MSFNQCPKVMDTAERRHQYMLQRMENQFRDFCAMHAMRGIMAMPSEEMFEIYGHTNISQAAFEQADTMLKARKAGK